MNYIIRLWCRLWTFLLTGKLGFCSFEITFLSLKNKIGDLKDPALYSSAFDPLGPL